MARTRRAVAALAIAMSAIAVSAGDGGMQRTHELTTLVGPIQPSGNASAQTTTGLIVLCFPTGGCIVCHDGYCEFTISM